MAVKYTIPYRSMDDQQWRIDIAENFGSNADAVVNWIVDQHSPLVQVGLLITDTTTGELVVNETETGSGSIIIPHGHIFQLFINLNNTPANPNPRLILTINENNLLTFEKSIPAVSGDTIIKTELASTGHIYKIEVTGDYSATQVTPVDIPYPSPTAAIPVRGNGSAGVVAWVADNTDDPFACYKSSTLTMNLIQEGQINISELQIAQDRDYIVRQYLNGALKWQGFLVPDGISYPLLSNPNNITLSAICGLTMLADIPYKHTDLPGTTSEIDYCPINYIRDILYLNLMSYLPIRWTNLLQCTAFDLQDVFTGGVQWSVNGEGYISYQAYTNSLGSGNTDAPGPPQSCDYILKGILQAMQCTIYLADGRWNIRRVTDLVRTSIPYKQIPADTEIMVIASGTQNITKQVGRFGYNFINQNALVTVKQGVKTCKTTYNANIRDNILPNGSFDYVDAYGASSKIRYWGMYDDTNPFVITAESLDGRNGYSADLIYEGFLGADQWFTMFTGTANPLGKNGLPIDSNTMIAYLVFGFLFEITGGGAFPLHDDGTINWDSDPLRIKVILNLGGIQWFLNRYGFWVIDDTYIPIHVDGLKLFEVATVDFNAFQHIILPITPPTDHIVAGYESNIQVMFRIAEGQFYKLDNVYINISKGNDVYESTYAQSKNTTVDERVLNISSSFGGYQLSNFMSSPFNSDEECFFRDAAVYTGTLTGLNSNAIMRCMYKAMRILNTDINVRNQSWSFDNTYLVDSMGTSLFLPLNASYDTEKCQVNGLVAIEIRNDFIDLDEKYYNSNDSQLSN